MEARYVKNPGISGSTHGLKNDIMPAEKAMPKLIKLKAITSPPPTETDTDSKILTTASKLATLFNWFTKTSIAERC